MFKHGDEVLQLYEQHKSVLISSQLHKEAKLFKLNTFYYQGYLQMAINEHEISLQLFESGEKYSNEIDSFEEKPAIQKDIKK